MGELYASIYIYGRVVFQYIKDVIQYVVVVDTKHFPRERANSLGRKKVIRSKVSKISFPGQAVHLLSIPSRESWLYSNPPSCLEGQYFHEKLAMLYLYTFFLHIKKQMRKCLCIT